MNKLIRSLVVLGAFSLSWHIFATNHLFDHHDRKEMDRWVAKHYNPLSIEQKETIHAACKANVTMLERVGHALQHRSHSQVFSESELKGLVHLWTHSGELIKQQGALEALEILCALNALSQIRLEWLKKIVREYEQEPGFLENIGAFFVEKGKYKLYRELNMIFKSSREIIEQFLHFEHELMKSF